MASLRAIGLFASAPFGVYAAYESSPTGLKRSVDFWALIAPKLAEHQGIKFIGWVEGIERAELDARLSKFHERTAAGAVDTILELGGIYVKLGQLISTLGAVSFSPNRGLIALPRWKISS